MNEPMQPTAGYESMTAARLLRALGSDRELLLEIIALFRRDAPAMFAAVRLQAEAADADALAKAAHVLKGSAANFGVSPLYEVARDIESCAFDGNLSQLTDLMTRFDRITDEFMHVLARLELEVQP